MARSHSSTPGRIERIEKSIEVDVPVSTAYNQWTQFEQFPSFMEGVEQVEQVDDTHLHWVAQVAGKRKEWDAEIVEQEPDRVISWRSTSGTVNNGSVTFEDLGDHCRIHLIMTYGVDDWQEKLGDALGILSAKVGADLRRFKEFVEDHQVATGGWRGEVHGGRKVREPGRRTHGRGRDVTSGVDAENL